MEHIINEYLENHNKINLMNGLSDDINSEECSKFLAKKSLTYLSTLLGMFNTKIIPFDTEDIPTNSIESCVSLTNARLKDHLESNESELSYKMSILIQNELLEKAVILGSSNRVDVYNYDFINIDNHINDSTIGDFIYQTVSNNDKFKLNPGKPWVIIPKNKAHEVKQYVKFVLDPLSIEKSSLTSDFVYLIGCIDDVEIYVHPGKFNGLLFGSNNSEMFGGIVLQIYNLAENVHNSSDYKGPILKASARYRLMVDSDNCKRSYMYYKI